MNNEYEPYKISIGRYFSALLAKCQCVTATQESGVCKQHTCTVLVTTVKTFDQNDKPALSRLEVKSCSYHQVKFIY